MDSRILANTLVQKKNRRKAVGEYNHQVNLSTRIHILGRKIVTVLDNVNNECFIRSRKRIREKTDARETKCKESEKAHVRKQAVRAANESTPVVTYYFILPSHVL